MQMRTFLNLNFSNDRINQDINFCSSKFIHRHIQAKTDHVCCRNVICYLYHFSHISIFQRITLPFIVSQSSMVIIKLLTCYSSLILHVTAFSRNRKSLFFPRYCYIDTPQLFVTNKKHFEIKSKQIPFSFQVSLSKQKMHIFLTCPIQPSCIILKYKYPNTICKTQRHIIKNGTFSLEGPHTHHEVEENQVI